MVIIYIHSIYHFNFQVNYFHVIQSFFHNFNIPSLKKNYIIYDYNQELCKIT